MGLLSDKIKMKGTGGVSTLPEEEKKNSLSQVPVFRAEPIQAPPAENIKDITIQSASQPQPQQTLYDIIKNYGKPYDYEQEIRQAERNRKIGMLTDILGLATNVATGAAGRRIFNPVIPQATAISDAKIQRLKDLQRNGLIQYNNALLNARLQDANNAAARAGQKAKQDWENAKWQAEFNRAMENDKDRALRWRIEQAGKEADREATERYRARSLGIQQQRVNNQIKGNKNKETDYLIGNNGRKTEFPKSMGEAIYGYLYRRMQNIMKSNPEGREDIEDTKIQMGEGGDQLTKMEAIVKRRIKDFPELQDELDYILEKGELPEIIVDFED